MSKLVTAILRNYLACQGSNTERNRLEQQRAFGALENYLLGVANHIKIDVTATDLTVLSVDIEDMLINLAVLTDDISGCYGDVVATASRLADVRAYLNLIYVKCGLSRAEVLAYYQGT